MNQTTDQRKKKMRFMLALPLLVLPFVTMVFWALGGGSGKQPTTNTAQGYNTSLPKASFKHEGLLDKMSYYDQADKDSAKLNEDRRADTSYHASAIQVFPRDTVLAGNYGTSMATISNNQYTSPAEQKVYARLADINRALAVQPSTEANNNSLKPSTASSGEDIDRLENMLGTMQQPQGPDPELQQINGMMDKILDVQHPERVQQRLKEKSRKFKQRVYPVTTVQDEAAISSLKSPAYTKPNAAAKKPGFYSLQQIQSDSIPQTAIDAIIPDRQTISDGATVKLRLAADVFINGTQILKGTSIYGVASLSNERLNIDIATIRYGDNIFPVSLAAYDLDGIAGIYIPGAMSRDVSKQSADQTIQSIGINSFDNSIGAQAATAGITAAKSLLSRKVKLVRVNIPAGYKVLLRDIKNNDNE